jgi:prepilin-type N-terminal cleavage/methylation domain-containing protein
MSHARTQSRGFSLLETLVSLALLGILMVTLNTFLFSMSELWGGKRDQRLFDQHVRAASRQVREVLEASTSGPGAVGFVVKEVRAADGTNAARIAFTLADAGRFADWPEAPLPDVDCSLHADPERGLILQWQSRLELERDLNDVHETVLTPFLASLGYDYYDADLRQWKTEEEPAKDVAGTAYQKPARLRLRFARGQLKSEVILDLPIKRPGASRP